ncbi:MAG TPA: SH3 domain-containing protein [Leptolyngbya sp.]|nr:SH3 domain-containing protein [Leptolyngbya sp.]
MLSNSFTGSSFAGCLVLLVIAAGCSSLPQSSPIATDSLASPSPQASPSAHTVPTTAQPPPTTSQPNSAAPNPSEAVRTVEKCVVRMARVNDPEAPLNIRSAPNSTSTIAGKLPNGAYVDVKEEQDGWFKIAGEMPGWIAKSRTESECGEKVEQIQLGNHQNSIEIRDRFVGVGNHSYRFNLTKGQQLTVTVDQGVFPQIIAPSGKNLVVSPEQSSPWTSQLSETGDYQFVFRSNFKGYQYAFSIEVR